MAAGSVMGPVGLWELPETFSITLFLLSMQKEAMSSMP
jgi:hypothetical protein